MPSMNSLLTIIAVTCLFIVIFVLDLRERRRETNRRQAEINEMNRQRDHTRKMIVGKTLSGADKVSSDVLHWLVTREGERAAVEATQDRREKHCTEWIIPPFDVKIRDGSTSIEFAFNNELWCFPPGTWHEAELSNDRLTYRIGWGYYYTAYEYLAGKSVSTKSSVEYWQEWTLTAISRNKNVCQRRFKTEPIKAGASEPDTER